MFRVADQRIGLYQNRLFVAHTVKPVLVAVSGEYRQRYSVKPALGAGSRG